MMALQNEKKVLYVAPVASTSFLEEAHWDGSTSSVCFTYRTQQTDGNGRDVRAVSIRFRRAMLLRMRAESFCEVGHIEDCYDTLVEVEHSDWLELETRYVPKARMDEAHHYMIYLDSVGCFEVIAEGWHVDDVLASKTRGEN